MGVPALPPLGLDDPPLAAVAVPDPPFVEVPVSPPMASSRESFRTELPPQPTKDTARSNENPLTERIREPNIGPPWRLAD
jgi:hypothetical protein